MPFEQGACLGIPGITAHRCVHAAGPVADRVVLIQGGGGAVGSQAVARARPDGYTLLFGGSGPNTIYPLVQKAPVGPDAFVLGCANDEEIADHWRVLLGDNVSRGLWPSTRRRRKETLQTLTERVATFLRAQDGVANVTIE